MKTDEQKDIFAGLRQAAESTRNSNAKAILLAKVKMLENGNPSFIKTILAERTEKKEKPQVDPDSSHLSKIRDRQKKAGE